MCHLVANYPNQEIALSAADSFIAGGARFLEIQLPFSDPSADGSAIANASTQTLKKGVSTQDALAFILKIHEKHPHIPIALMSYVSLIFTPGVEIFCAKAKQAGVSFFIIPDLPFDCDENLRESAQKLGIQLIPVAAPSMSEKRLNALLKQNFPFIYAALRRGITGELTVLTEETIHFLKKLKSGGAQILGGFGVADGKTALQISPWVDVVVAGSVFVRLIEQHADDLETLKKALIAKTKELSAL